MFAGLSVTMPDERRDYGEPRWQTYGLIGGRLVMIVWTERGADRQVISMRKCNEREQARFGDQLGRSG